MKRNDMYRSGYIRCWACNGNGRVNVVRKSGPWDSALCTDCNGSGKDEKKTYLYKHGK